MKNKHLILFFILVLYCCYGVLKGDANSSTSATTQVIKETTTTEEQPLMPQNVTVRIQHFNVTGKKFVFMNKSITEFLGVPYVYPHNSSRRFLPSLPINKANVKNFKLLKNKSFVNDSYQAFTLANACPQYINKTGFIGMDMLIPNTEVSEDCLQLNMWVPEKNETENDGKNMSTIVFLYGGSFAVGSASINFYNGSVLALTQNVIVITLNYRIGPLGFAYFGEDTEAKGNVGLLDQQEGLKWISKNIEYFGGNKNDITLFGESAGAASVTAHLLSNNSYKYFDKIIVNSGAITNVWATVSQKQALNNTLWLAKLMNCNNRSSEEITQNNTEVLECMQKEDVNLTDMNNIYQFEVRDEEQPPFPYPFLPMYNDTVFFNESIFKRLKYGKVKKNVTAMYGRTAHEGSLFLPFMLGYKHGCGYNYSLPANASENKCLNISSFTVFASWYELGKFYKASLFDRLKLGFKFLESPYKWPYTNIKSMITNMGHIPGKLNRDKMVTAIGDFLFNCDTAKFAKQSNLGKKTKVYFFEFKKNSTVNPWPQWMNPMHGYELEYVFGMPYRNSSLYDKTVLSDEKKYADKIMTFYGSFAKNGYPNESWHPYKEENKANFNNSNCALLDANITKNDHKLLYRRIITDKCNLLNEIAEKHSPRCVDCFSLIDYVYSLFSWISYWGNPENIWNEISKNETFISFTNRTINFGTSFF